MQQVQNGVSPDGRVHGISVQKAEQWGDKQADGHCGRYFVRQVVEADVSIYNSFVVIHSADCFVDVLHLFQRETDKEKIIISSNGYL